MELTPSLNDLRNQITKTINQSKRDNSISFASIYFRDLNNGPWLGINEKELFSPASLVKVPLMMAYYKLAEKDPNFLNQKLKTAKDTTPEEQNILPQATLIPEQEYTIDQIITQMIVNSDNYAYGLLTTNIDPELFRQIFSDLGIDITKALTDPTGNVISVKDYASFFRILFNSSYLNKDMSEKALSLLSQTKYDQGLVSGIKPGTTISHKFGERTYLPDNETQLHDCGIVYLPNKPYLLCVMTRGRDTQKLATFIKNISAQVYQEISPL